MENVTLPSIAGQFSYGLEIVDPATQNVISANVRSKFKKKSNTGISYIKYMKYIVYTSTPFMVNISLKAKTSFSENLQKMIPLLRFGMT